LQFSIVEKHYFSGGQRIMQTLLMLNPKGGSGKSTLATNLASFFSCWGVGVSVADYDPQLTALDWLARRPASLPKIEGQAVQVSACMDSLANSQCDDYLIMDAPSGHYGNDLLPFLEQANKIIIPVVPSPHDISAAERFLNWMVTLDWFESQRNSIAIVANRVRHSTRSFKLLKGFLHSAPVPCVGVLRDTQNYVMAAQYGLSIFELPSYKVSNELRRWQPLINWLCVDRFLYPAVPLNPNWELKAELSHAAAI
jgi:chromosome partitioning protein